MKIIHSGKVAPKAFSKSIFLAGPTPRSDNVASWRPEALRLLESRGYDGVVFVPEFRGFSKNNMPEGWTWEKQCDWEHKYLDMSDIILFWVPRKLRVMPAFTTNVEFGLYANSGRVVFGAPSNWKNFPKNRYLKFMADKFVIPRFDTLGATIKGALEIIGKGAMRRGTESLIPLNLWQSASFQNWYQAKIKTGHKLKNAKVEFTIRKGMKKDWIYAWGLWVDIDVHGENRRKYNESVISRPDISTVFLYQRAPNSMDTKVVLVREFRSPARTADGFIWELPGGSSFGPDQTPQKVASEEIFEETGFKIDPVRFRVHQSRQLAGTFSAHKSSLFSAEITSAELAWFERQKGIAHGSDPKNSTGERTYIEIKTIKEILENELLDWSNIGMILSVLNQPR